MSRPFLATALVLALALQPMHPAIAQAAAAAPNAFNVRNADIRAFIQDAARVTGRTFIIDPGVQGRVSVVTQRPVSTSEYFELFLSTMRANGFVAVPVRGGAFRIQPIAGAAASAPVGGRRHPSGFVTEIFRVRHVDAAQAVESLRPLVSRDGAITANRGSIIVSDFADNVARVRQVLARIDVDQSATRVVGLQNAGAREIAAALVELSRSMLAARARMRRILSAKSATTRLLALRFAVREPCGLTSGRSVSTAATASICRRRMISVTNWFCAAPLLPIRPGCAAAPSIGWTR